MKKTPLYDLHVALGGQMVEFAGYSMPVRYSSEKIEHMAVRSAAGLFDVSHMGEIFLTGPKACDAADLVMTNDVGKADQGQAVYGVMLNDKAGIVDDIVAYKFASDKILLCVNASNREKDFAWIKKIVREVYSENEVLVEDLSDEYAQIALQGPKAASILSEIVSHDLAAIGKFRFFEGDLKVGESNLKAIVARTGYTGEDGFEIFLAPRDATVVWNELLKRGSSLGLISCGLSARDTLRLEAGMCLYGNDIDDATSPLEAGLSWVVKWDKKVPFYGRAGLALQKERGISRKLVGITLSDRNIARAGYEISDDDGNVVGKVTSGTISPFLGIPIAMAYVKKPFAEVGSKVYVDIRRNKIEAVVTKLPFYKRAQGL